MSPLRFFPTLAAAVCVIAAVACADSTSAPPTGPSPPAYIPSPTLITLTGTVHVTLETETGIILRTPDREIRLAGHETERLDRVDGAEVEVRGTWNGDAELFVNDFLVRAVGGVAALDGVVTKMFADDLEYEFVGYGLRLTRGALIVPLVNPPNDLIEHLGDRVWVTGAPGGPPTAYGVIGVAMEPE